MSEQDYPELTLEIMDLVGNKWTLLLVYRLADGARRFSELKRCAAPISQKMLTQKLRELESLSPNAAATQIDGTQMSLLVPAEETSPAVEALENLDPDSLTPRQALEWIYRLKSLV